VPARVTRSFHPSYSPSSRVDFRELDGLAAENAVRLLAHFIVGIVLGYVLDRVSVFVRQEL
jgi:hypothetical protein